MDDLNEIASAAEHEALARFGEVARERERVARKDAIRSGTCTVATSPGSATSTGPPEGHRFEPRARRRRRGAFFGRRLPGDTQPDDDDARSRRARFTDSPRVASDIASILADRADIERRTSAALERERADADRAAVTREEALERKRADLRRVEREVLDAVERRREAERRFRDAARDRTDARTTETIAVAEREVKAEEARVRATNEAREASFVASGGAVDSIEPAVDSALDDPRRPRRLRLRTPSGKRATRLGAPGTKRPAVTPERAARRAALGARRRTREPRTRGGGGGAGTTKNRASPLQRDADALVRQERRVAEKQRRADGVARRKESNAKAEFADRSPVREASRCASTRRGKKDAIDEEHAPAFSMRGAERRNGARSRRCNARGRGRRTRSRARPSRERHVKIRETSEKLHRRLLPESALRERDLSRDEEAFLSKIASRAERIGAEADGVMARAFDVEARAEEEAARREASAGRMTFERVGAFSRASGTTEGRFFAGGSQEGSRVPGGVYARAGRVRRDSFVAVPRAVLVRAGVGDWRIDPKS